MGNDDSDDDDVRGRVEKRRSGKEPSAFFVCFMTSVANVLSIVSSCFSAEGCKKYHRKWLRTAPFERVFRLRLGRPTSLLGPGFVEVLPWIDDYWIIDQRAVVVDVPPQAVLTKDSVTVAVDAVMVYKIIDPMSAVTQVEDPIHATSIIAVTALRTELGKRTLSEVLTEREEMAASMRKLLDELTEPWGMQIQRVDIKNVSLPPELQKVMAKEAEAKRETKARVITSEGEVNTAKAFVEAAATMFNNPSALQLRYLQALNSISADKDSTVVFPFPMDYLESFQSQSGPSMVVEDAQENNEKM